MNQADVLQRIALLLLLVALLGPGVWPRLRRWLGDRKPTKKEEHFLGPQRS